MMTEADLIDQILEAAKDIDLTVVVFGSDEPSTVYQLLDDCVSAGFSVWWDNEAQKVRLT